MRGKGSSPFDDEGVKTQARDIIQNGQVQGYFLSSYSARKLGMQTTGNSGGSHNLVMRSTQTRSQDDLKAMLKKLKEVIEKNTDLFYEAIHKDFGKSKFETFTTEISFVLKDKRKSEAATLQKCRRKLPDRNNSLLFLVV
jgi:predicted Zn-dependent protease